MEYIFRYMHDEASGVAIVDEVEQLTIKCEE